MRPRIGRAVAGALVAVALCAEATQAGHGEPQPRDTEVDRGRPTIIYVDDDNTSGPWDGTVVHPYRYIQDGIDNAAAGDTVMVLAGTYCENLVIDRSVELLGEDIETTTIDGGGVADVAYVSADGVVISGFTVTGGGGSAAINLRSNGNTISGNRLTDNDDVSWGAIYLFGSSHNAIFTNAITNTYAEAGIWLNQSSSYNDISHNTFTDNGFIAIVAWNQSSHNTIAENTVRGYHGPMWIRESSHNAILNNVFKSYQHNPVSLDDSSYTVITGNQFTLGGGITIDYFSRDLEFWATHTIEQNFVAGAPIYYYKDAVGVTVPDDAAQVILANCTNCTIEGLTLDRACDPIQLGFSSENLISGNAITCDWYSGGIFMVECFDNVICDNDLLSTYDDYIGSAGIDGIHTEEGSGHMIHDNVIVGFHIGMLLRNRDATSGNVISRNVVSSPRTGIHVIRYNESTAKTIISDNTVFDCGSDGIHSFGWYPLTVIDNQLLGNALYISCDGLETWEDIVIAGNTIDGKNVYYFHGLDNVTVPTDAGQVILVDCWNFLAADLCFLGSGRIHALYCPGGRITGNVFEDVSLGVRLDVSPDNVCCKNVFTGCGTSIRLNDGCDNSRISDNVITENTRLGMFLSGVDACRVTNNVIVGALSYPGYGQDGVYLSRVTNSVVSENTIACMGSAGMSLNSESTGNEITGNSIARCGWCGVAIDDSDVTGNVLSANDLVESDTNAWERNGTVGNSWTDDGIGNFWSDFEQNPGYPDYYEIPGDGDGIDWIPLENVSRCPFARGDIDGSCGQVDFADFEAFIECWDLSPDECGDYGCSDLDGDGAVDLVDFARFSVLYATMPVIGLPDCGGE